MGKANISEEDRKRRSENMKKVQAERAAKLKASVVSGEEIREQKEKERDVRTYKNYFSGATSKLGVLGEIPGYVMRVFNHENIPIALQSGWQFVSRNEAEFEAKSLRIDDSDDGTDRVVTLTNPRTQDGERKFGYLMKIPKEIYDQYMKEQREVAYSQRAKLSAIPEQLKGRNYLVDKMASSHLTYEYR